MKAPCHIEAVQAIRMPSSRRRSVGTGRARHSSALMWTTVLVLTVAALQTASSFVPAASSRCRGSTAIFGAASDRQPNSSSNKRPFSGDRRPFTKSGAHVTPSPAHPSRPRQSVGGGEKKASTTSSRMSSAVLEAPRPSKLSRGPSKVADFQDRMRRLVTRDRQREAEGRSRTATDPHRRHPNVMVIDTLEEYKTVVGDEKDRLVVVRFYATWCKACKAMAPLFYRLASTYEDCVFVEVPVTDRNSALHQGLGVPSLPFGHIYDPEAGLVEEHKINRKYFARFARSVKAHRSGGCELPDGDPANPYPLPEEG